MELHTFFFYFYGEIEFVEFRLKEQVRAKREGGRVSFRKVSKGQVKAKREGGCPLERFKRTS
ncbi:hypothetical protein [Heyndrickxia camelliae]|uniref:Uncharacterized protein n=1 Tax=Heyndrickxia camelliae TaxID=1707093 RepID=A0A2N3LP01_9BACI|nr:hypothetical protein [Heyndrickxia camelliae]PKR86243.1 hypothetical protein CWO92_03845 [Heyndrickxia camelliae]